MTITGGFGVTVDLQTGVPRAWYMGTDGVQRWADTGEPVGPGVSSASVVTLPPKDSTNGN